MSDLVTRLAFALLEEALATSKIRHQRDARPIVFEVFGERAAIWSFDPRRSGALFAQGDLASAALRLSLRAEDLIAIAGGRPLDRSRVDALGDVGALDALRRALVPPRTIVSIRQ